MRPTASKVRESVFNILRDRVQGAVFIDLYAGTGAVGMEAMAQGAGAVYFIESDARRARVLREALEECGCRCKVNVIASKAAQFIKRFEQGGVKADLVFLDPPYYSGEMETMLRLLSGGGMLAEGAVVLAEHHTKRPLPWSAGLLKTVKTYRYGDTTLTLMRKETP